MRSFIVLLLFVIFFLAGTVFGINRSHNESEPVEQSPQDVIVTQQEIDEADQNETEVVQAAASDIANIDASQSMMQKTASFIGAGVKQLFEAMAAILYQIAKAFF